MKINDVNIALVIPWREQTNRIEPFNKTIENYKKFFDDESIILCDKESEIFNASASRNIGISQAFNSGADIVLVSDADILIEIETLKKAITLSLSREEIFLLYENYIRVIFDSDSMKTLGEYNLRKNRNSGYFYPCSGALLIPKRIYQELGGYDENFLGWGPEDLEYHYRYFLKYKKMYSFIENSKAYSIEHSRKDWQSEELENNNNKYFFNKHKVNDFFEHSFRDLKR